MANLRAVFGSTFRNFWSNLGVRVVFPCSPTMFGEIIIMTPCIREILLPTDQCPVFLTFFTGTVKKSVSVSI